MAWLFPARLVHAAGGFDESLRFAEDWDFFVKVGMLGATLLVNKRLGCYYRQRPGSMSANRVGMATARARILIRLHDRLREANRPDWFGLDLLKIEQGGYQALVKLGVKDDELLERAAAAHLRAAEARRLRPVRLALPPDGALPRLCAGRAAALPSWCAR